MKYGWIAQQRGVWPTRLMCRLLAVSASGLYDWLGRGSSARALEDRRLLSSIRASFEASDATYGSPRVWRELRAVGERCGLHRVERLMRLGGLRARPLRRRPCAVPGEQAAAIAANHLQREFAADAPNRKWTADFTYLKTAEGWLYVAVVMDLYSRRIVGWSMKPQMTAQLVADALIMALWRRGRPGQLLHHSDRGSQYTSQEFQALLADCGITCSMSRAGNVWANSVTESFFSTLKTERTSRRAYRTRDEARADVFDYIERFYNPHRQHSTLDYLSPVEFENVMLQG